ncbi:MAG: nickel transporter permease [Candidatus Aerophobetes bacterium]|nr:nickel transporter permease [Candidatus Aerophobetes bacterium]
MLGRLTYSFRLARRNPLTAMGLLVVLLLVLVALLAPWIASYPKDIGATHIEERFLSPSLNHPFGTDELGRDVFSRVIYGSRISLEVGILAIGLALLIGIPLGVIAGYSGGVIDEVIMRVTDVFLSFPSLLLAMVISAMLGPNLRNAMIAIAISWWPWYTRLLRGEAISTREEDFVIAAKSIGCSWKRITFKHVLPNCLAPVIVQASMDFGSIILTCASLSFLGLGAQPPTPEWGLMISTGRTFFLTHWWIVTFPGVAIFIVVLSFNLVGDGLREILDPRMRRGRKV